MRATRREALVAGAGLLAAACGAGTGGRRGRAPAVGSTLVSTWIDTDGTGALSKGPGEPLLDRTELGARARATAVLSTLVHVTDAHVLDASSPARVPFLDRLGPPFQSTFRPQEALTAQVLASIVPSINAARPRAVIQGGDLIDNDQANEIQRALTVLRGGTVRPGPYAGVQASSNADPFYYRPDLDAPRHPGLLRVASEAFRSGGLHGPVLPVLGDHDILLGGVAPPSPLSNLIATGEQAVWELPRDFTRPRVLEASSPDGPPLPGRLEGLIAELLRRGEKVRVPADPSRRELSTAEVIAALKPESAGSLDYAVDLGRHVRVIVLDLARRAGGSGGLVRPGQADRLVSQLEAAGDRWAIVVSHQPLASSEGGEELLAVLDRAPRVIAALAGHTHRNRIEARPSPAGGYWLIQTSSLIDFPQQARALQVVGTKAGVAIRTWMLDHTGALARTSRELAYLDAQGGRPGHFAGRRTDRNVTLYRSARTA